MKIKYVIVIYIGELVKSLPSKERNIIYKTKALLGRKLKDKKIEKIFKKELKIKKVVF